MIQLENVTKIYNNNGVLTTGLHHINLNLNKNEIVAIVGESGSGKSTLLNVLTKMDTFDEGEYYYKGNETSYFDINDMDDFRKNKVGFIFQNYNIIDSYSVLENVMLPFKLKGISHLKAKEKALDLISKVGLIHRVKNKGSQLSGGEKQRCVIARALASDCEILACDEPTGNLDSKTSQEIIALIKQVAQDKLVLIVTHDFEQVKDIVTRKIKVHDGNIIEDIIYHKIENDKNEEMNLDYQPLKQKIKLDIAKNNLVNTPKRTLFTSLIFLFVAFFALCMYQSIYTSINNEQYTNLFIYKGENKAIIYNSSANKMIDINDIKEVCEVYEINNFYETTTMAIQGFMDYSIEEFGYEKYPYQLVLDEGRLPNNENECLVLMPSYFTKKELHEILNTQIYLPNTIKKEISIVGYQIRDDVEYPTITYCDYFENYFRIQAIANYNSLTCSILDEYNEELYYDVSLIYRPDITTSKLITPYELNYTHLELSPLKIGNFSFNIDLSNIECVSNENPEYGYCYLYVGDSFIKEYQKTPYEVAIYTNNLNYVISNLQKKGYLCAKVKTFSNESELQHFINNITSYLLMFMSTIIILIIYFISYIVLNKIYASKKKDYTILRTLGISKNDMKDVVCYEVMIQTILVSIFVFISICLFGLFANNEFAQLFKKVSIMTSVLYFAIMLLFGYFIARRFNKKLFKFSVYSTLKKGEEKHD